jgi:glutathione S-transferase
MLDSPMSRKPFVLYGGEFSLYTGKARSYLRKKGVPFTEMLPTHPDFQRVSRVAGSSRQPTLETPEGEVIQDTTEIIDSLEARFGGPSVYPDGPCQRLVALLLELFGDEGLLKPAMHYRWNFPDENDAFLEAEFDRMPQGFGPAHAGDSGSERHDASTPWRSISGIMRGRLIEALGVTPASAPAIEAAYEDLLGALEVHFRAYPYLLGGRPSIGDFGMIAPLYAHLGRDPYPASLMKRLAPSCNRWVERMLVADAGMSEFPDLPEEFLPEDEVPETLLPVLSLMARDYLPELIGTLDFVEAWLGEHPEIEPGSPVPASTLGMGTANPLGFHTVQLRGTQISQAVRHYSLWMLQRPLDAYAAMSASERAHADDLLEGTGLLRVLGLRPRWRIERVAGVERFGD